MKPPPSTFARAAVPLVLEKPKHPVTALFAMGTWTLFLHDVAADPT